MFLTTRREGGASAQQAEAVSEEPSRYHWVRQRGPPHSHSGSPPDTNTRLSSTLSVDSGLRVKISVPSSVTSPPLKRAEAETHASSSGDRGSDGFRCALHTSSGPLGTTVLLSIIQLLEHAFWTDFPPETHSSPLHFKMHPLL